MREELQNARSRETALKLKEKELIASLSHDLKTPIAGIQIICELLLVKLKDAYTIGKINEIHQKSMQISEMVNDLLTSSLDELGEMNVTLNDENAEILHEIVAANDPRQLVQDGSIPECLISVDKTRLRQAIGNIISNSYKYANTTIDIRYSLMDGYLKMAISDHGAGISADELPLVTNKFYRGKSFRNSGKEGSGLGLYIASELLNRMNGELICSSKEGEGLTVILLMPLS
jgi:signal transduction histidine kinase